MITLVKSDIHTTTSNINNTDQNQHINPQGVAKSGYEGTLQRLVRCQQYF